MASSHDDRITCVENSSSAFLHRRHLDPQQLMSIQGELGMCQQQVSDVQHNLLHRHEAHPWRRRLQTNSDAQQRHPTSRMLKNTMFSIHWTDDELDTTSSGCLRITHHHQALCWTTVPANLVDLHVQLEYVYGVIQLVWIWIALSMIVYDRVVRLRAALSVLRTGITSLLWTWPIRTVWIQTPVITTEMFKICTNCHVL